MALLVSCALSAEASAAVTVKPAGDTLLATSTSVTFALGTAAGEPAIICSLSQASGVIPTSSSKVTLANPIFQGKNGGECETSKLEGAKFKVITHSHSPENLWELFGSTEKLAGIAIPGEIAFQTEYGLEFVDGTCKVGVHQTNLEGAWTNGVKASPLATPSSLTFSGPKISFKPFASEVGCPPAFLTEAHKKEGLNVTATYIVNDITHLNEPVRIG